MKNAYKVLGIIALVVMAGFSFTACSNGSTDSPSGNGKLLEFYLTASGDLRVKYENINYGQITYNGNPDLADVIPDFKVTIGVSDVTITALSGGAGALDFKITGTYTTGNKHTVKVVYTANPSRKLMTTGYKGEDVVVSKFEEEAELTVKPY